MGKVSSVPHYARFGQTPIFHLGKFGGGMIYVNLVSECLLCEVNGAVGVQVKNFTKWQTNSVC